MNDAQFAPVSGGKHVVGCVIAIVQQQPVRDAAGNVAGVIDLRFEVAILVLQQERQPKQTSSKMDP